MIDRCYKPAIEQTQHISAIALTAHAAEFDHHQALQAGFQRHLAKPVEPEFLVKEILKLLGNNSASDLT